ncbi:MAG: cardiolipin synthase [Clostridiales bacterium]|nr:cardiolipin synthase [Clostridiales bacterium]MDU1041618.1 cardiolipin synthase [Clostridiales bacterium]MDU3490910.1 cardiolipin synthase [Clostridiales bacterium]
MSEKHRARSEVETRRKRGLMSFIFGRQTIVLAAVAAQIWIVLLMVTMLGDYSRVINYCLKAASLIFVVVVLSTDWNMSYKLAWIILMLLFPVFGFVVVIFYYQMPNTRKIVKRSINIDKQIDSSIKKPKESYMSLKQEAPEELGLINYFSNGTGMPVYKDIGCTYFPTGEDKWRRLIDELKKARHFIFMEYFIIDEGEMWGEVLDVLLDKIKEGVEVRVIYDGTTSLGRLPYGYFERLEKKGLNSRCFSRVYPFIQPYQNNRDHRKIVIIDGCIAMTGGINLSDEYINRWKRYGNWKDTAVMIRGEAVDSFTYMFLEMWFVAGEWEEVPEFEIRRFVDEAKCYRDELDAVSPIESDKSLSTGGYVVPFGDNPYAKERVGRQVYMDILNRAEGYVHIMTPYLVPDQEMLSALKYAAVRGVETVIIMPHIPDKKPVYFLGRSYFPELLKAGVKIYEYMPGFIHAKQFVSDSKRAVVGSINLDFRSMYLHFESALYMYKNEVVEVIEEDVQATLSKCQEITLEKYRNYNRITKIIGYILRVISPLL